MKSSILHLLQHPALQRLEAQSPRETLLFIKGHTLGMAATLEAIRQIGLENVEALYDHALPDMWHNIDTCTSLEGGNQ